MILNRLKSIRLKHEIIKGVSIRERARMNGVEMTVRKALRSVEENGLELFPAVEQGHGVRNTDIFAHYYPECKPLVY